MFVKGLPVMSIDVVGNGCELYFTCVVNEILHDHLVEQEPEYRGCGFKTREEMGVLDNGVLLTSFEVFEVGIEFLVKKQQFLEVES